MKNFIKIFVIVAVVAVATGFMVNNALAALDNTSGTGCGGCGGGNTGGRDGSTDHTRDTPPPRVQVYASCDSFTGSPTTLPNGGGSVTLTWNTTNANSVSINQGIGSVAADGSTSVNVTESKTFTLTAVGTDGNDTCTVSVTVQPPVVNAPSCDSFTGSPTTLPFGGGNVTLNWATTNATGVSIDNGVGSVSVDGSTSVNVTTSKTFVLTATNVAGASVTCNVPVTVNQNSSFSCDYFNVDKTTVDKGETFTLTWGTTNADSVSINNGVGSVSADGSYSTSIQGDTTYVLTATKGNETITCSRPVSVRTSGGGGGGSSSPKCDFDISAKDIKKGKEITLTWNTTRATRVEIEDNHGNTLLDTNDLDSDDRKDFYDGDMKLKPSKDTTYTLTASKGSKDRTCKVSVDVDGEVTVLEVRDQKPLVTGIKLTQVPYTGFEAGPILTYFFYAMLALWGLFIAYSLVLKKKVS